MVTPYTNQVQTETKLVNLSVKTLLEMQLTHLRQASTMICIQKRLLCPKVPFLCELLSIIVQSRRTGWQTESDAYEISVQVTQMGLKMTKTVHSSLTSCRSLRSKKKEGHSHRRCSGGRNHQLCHGNIQGPDHWQIHAHCSGHRWRIDSCWNH